MKASLGHAEHLKTLRLLVRPSEWSGVTAEPRRWRALWTL